MTIHIENAPRRKADHRIQQVQFQRTAELGLPMDQAPLLYPPGRDDPPQPRFVYLEPTIAEAADKAREALERQAA